MIGLFKFFSNQIAPYLHQFKIQLTILNCFIFLIVTYFNIYRYIFIFSNFVHFYYLFNNNFSYIPNVV